MNVNTERERAVHQGSNVKRFREMLGLKQEALAILLGEEWSQRRVSIVESKETIDPELLRQIAQALNVPEEAIKQFDERAAVTYFNTFNDNSFSNSYGAFPGNYYTFNPIDKWLEVIEENKQLYERLLASEREKVELLKENSRNT